MKLIKLSSADYPENLKNVSVPPEKIFVKGQLKPEDSLAVAIVGSRKLSSRGQALARDYSFYLAGKGVTVVSGLARGIDTVVHAAALSAGGRTIAVVANGLDRIYPPENNSLAEKIVKNGALISEFDPGTPPLAENFLARNRIISGLSLAVLVIEGARKSGTLSTASHAGSQGREVFVIPGSAATDWLLSRGATEAESPAKILEYLHSQV